MQWPVKEWRCPHWGAHLLGAAGRVAVTTLREVSRLYCLIFKHIKATFRSRAATQFESPSQ